MSGLAVNIAGVTLKNPVITASGCCGYGREYEAFYPIERLGGISVKGTTLHERQGNPPARIAETPAGMLNSVGLQNPGVDVFLSDYLPALAQRDVAVIANIAGSSIEEYAQTAAKLRGSAVDLIEINISCPNVKEGGVAFGVEAGCAAAVVRAVRDVSDKPLIVKLSPNVTDIVSIARAAEDAGADAISLINTLLGMRIDLKTRRPVLHQNVGGLSGPAVFPIAVRMVWQVANAVKVPVIGMGGVSSWQDALEMMMAGACAVQVGAALFADAYAPIKIIDGLEQWMRENHVTDLQEVVGSVKPY